MLGVPLFCSTIHMFAPTNGSRLPSSLMNPEMLMDWAFSWLIANKKNVMDSGYITIVNKILLRQQLFYSFNNFVIDDIKQIVVFNEYKNSFVLLSSFGRLCWLSFILIYCYCQLLIGPVLWKPWCLISASIPSSI